MSYRKILLWLLMTGGPLFACSQTMRCKELHTGKFKLNSKETGVTLIIRTHTQQLEENEKLGVKMIFDVVWVNACTYELHPKKVLQGDPSYMGKPGDYMTVVIKEIKEHSYISETTSNFYTGSIVSEIEIDQ